MVLNVKLIEMSNVPNMFHEIHPDCLLTVSFQTIQKLSFFYESQTKMSWCSKEIFCTKMKWIHTVPHEFLIGSIGPYCYYILVEAPKRGD